MRVAVVAGGYGSSWDERHVLVRRVAGALACAAEVDVVVPGTKTEAGYDGAVRVYRFEASHPDPARRQSWRFAMLGDHEHDDMLDCTCMARRQRRERNLPDIAEQELVRAEGGDAPELYKYISGEAYDVTVFVGFHTPAAYWGGRALPDERRVVLVPGMIDDHALWLRIHDYIFERASRILVCTESERVGITRRLGPKQAAVVKNIGFVTGVNSLARSTEPHDLDDRRYVLVARDWHGTARVDRFLGWARHLEDEIHPDLQLRLVGPGADRLPLGIRLTSSRLDVWRWMHKALCLIDPLPHRLLAREVLEAMLYETPVVVNANGGASREHAEQGDGGLWYRTDDELYAAVSALLTQDVHDALGLQGRAYTEENFTNTDSYVKTVGEAVLE